jgi:hypothetical protein
MRAFFLGLVLVAAGALGACSAVDNFNRFHFVSDGGTDLAGADMTPALPTFGQACVDQCASPSPMHALTCFHMFGQISAPGGICTHSCNAQLGNLGCSDVPDANCVTVEGMDVCLPRCDPSLGKNCRPNYGCCANGQVVTGQGSCAPTDTNLCH